MTFGESCSDDSLTQSFISLRQSESWCLDFCIKRKIHQHGEPYEPSINGKQNA